MTRETKEAILGFAVYNRYTEAELLPRIARELCADYGWPPPAALEEQKACIVRAAKEKKDLYAVATVLFLKHESPVIEQCGYFFSGEALLIEMIELLDGVENKDAFCCFLLGRAHFSGRGGEIDEEKILFCFERAAESGLEIARLFCHELRGEQKELFAAAKELIGRYPDSHIVKFYLAHGYYYGIQGDPDYQKVLSLCAHAHEGADKTPMDYYFLSCRYLLGLCRFHGHGIKRDLAAAQRLFEGSAASYLPEAQYALAVTKLLSEEKKQPQQIWELLKQSALRGCLSAARKVMLCLRKGYGTEADKQLYTEYADYYDHEKERFGTVSDLGAEADHCDLVDENNVHVADDEPD